MDQVQENANHTIFTNCFVLHSFPVNCTLDYTSTNFFILVLDEWSSISQPIEQNSKT